MSLFASCLLPAMDDAKGANRLRGQRIAIVGIDAEVLHADGVIPGHLEAEEGLARPGGPFRDFDVFGPTLSWSHEHGDRRQVLPPSVLVVTRMRSFSLRARNWALTPRPTRSPGTSIGTVIVPVPPFHQQASYWRLTLSKRMPIVVLVSFLVNDGSGVIRQTIDRVAIDGSASAATVIVFFPLPSQGKVRGACWKLFSTWKDERPAPPVSSNRSQ